MNIAIRVDSGSRIGAGHVMRCLTLARAMKYRGASVLFVCKDHVNHFGPYIQGQGFPLVLIEVRQASRGPYEYSRWVGGSELDDAEQTIKVVQSVFDCKVDLLICDHYGLGRCWEHSVRDVARKLLVIDDLSDRAHECDLLIDQTLGKCIDDYKALVNAGCELLIGSSYAILREEFSRYSPGEIIERRRLVNSKALGVLVMMGGTDPDDYSSRAIDSLLDDPVVKSIDVLLSPQADHVVAVQARYVRRKNVFFHIGSARISDLLFSCDLAIAAAGGGSWERCRMGLPSVLNVNATNQMRIARSLQAAGACEIIDPGDFSGSIHGYLRSIFYGANYRDSVSRCLDVCDGLGVNRIVGVIERIAGNG